MNRDIKKHVEVDDRLKQQIMELSTLNEIGRAITSTIKLDELWELIYKQACRVIEISDFYIALYDREKEELYNVINLLHGKPRSQGEKRRKLGNGRTEYIIRTKKPLLIHGEAKEIYDRLGIVTGDKRARNYVGVPIVYGVEIIGVLAIQNYKRKDVYDEHTIELLSATANYAAIAIENSRLYEETKLLATTDHLTGVWNRRYIDEHFQTELVRAHRFNRQVSVLMIDIDKFKIFNDTYGHPSGDEVIRTVARAILSSCRETDLVGRYGGDEFAIILPETDTSGAAHISDRILNNIKKKTFTAPDGTKSTITLSIGIVSYPSDGKEAEQLLSLADAAMYRAKSSGGGQFKLENNPT